MNKSTEHLLEIKLVGLTARTSNALETKPQTAQIGALMQRFFRQGIPDHISHRKTPGRIFSVYTAYESDEHGPYTYFLGEEVTCFEGVGREFQLLTIPAQNYIKFTSNPGPMPTVVIDMWQDVWKMDPRELGGKRSYLADFEIYDERSRDPNCAVLDIYIGVQK